MRGDDAYVLALKRIAADKQGCEFGLVMGETLEMIPFGCATSARFRSSS
jgi:hypothetical protein